MESTWVECVLNGEWQGCYLFCEHVRVASERIDVFDWEDASETRGHAAEDLSWVDPATDDITGGYVFEFDYRDDAVSSFRLSSGNITRMLTKVDCPEYLRTNESMMDWCQGYLQDYFDACTSPDGYCKGRHYSEYCDIDSMVTYFLVMEMCGNWDARCLSRYCSNLRLDAVIPFERLTAAKGDPNCMSLVVYDGAGRRLARNYVLVTLTDWDDARDATEPRTVEGEEVPSVPYRWIRDAAVSKVPSLATATEEADFAAALLAVPSPWGKATPLWQDWVAGTNPDPNGTNATFRITSVAVTNGVPHLTWAPDLGAQRTYTTWGKVDLGNREETWTSPASAGARLFRVKVSLPGTR